MRKLHVYFTLFLFCTFNHPIVHAQNKNDEIVASTLKPPFPFNFEEKIKNGMQLWDIPGLSLSIVKDGEILYSNAFGYSNIQDSTLLTVNSLFGISSVTKNFTAAACAILIDEGKLSWDTKIIDVLPEFQLKDPWITQNVTIRDALSHKVGISRVIGSRLRYRTTSSISELMNNLQYFDFDSPFRSDFVYSNLMYSVLGEVVAKVSGETFENFIKKRLFEPLQMHSVSSLNDYLNQNNRALPYQLIDRKIEEIAPRNWDHTRASGGIYASPLDLAKWLIMQLNAGKYKENRIISTQQIYEMHRPQNVRSQVLPYSSQNTYGFGWHITDYQGKRILFHSGRSDGFAVATFMIPELELGIAVMSNAHSNIGEAIAYQVMDLFLGNPNRDWIQLHHVNYLAAYEKAQTERDAIHNNKKANTSPELPINRFLGTYYSEQYGKLEIISSSNGLMLKLWDDEFMVADVEFWHDNVFRAIWKERAMREEFIEFKVENGKLKGVVFEFSLRPELIQVGAYPASSVRKVFFEFKAEN